jgi:hypothetical protein
MKNKTKQNKKSSGGRAVSTAAAPAAVGGRFKNRAPRIRQKANELLIDHTEPLGTGVLDGSVGFSLTRFILNPAEELTFPWMAAIAHNWERYEFTRITIEYVPRCSTATSGAVTLAYEPDVTDEAPTSEADLLIYSCSVNSAGWQASSCTLTRADLHPNGPRYTRTSVRAGDNRISDAGVFNVATVGMADTSTVGRLFVTYSVRLFCPHSEINDLLRPAESLVFEGRTATEAVTAGVAITKVNFALPYGSPYPQAQVESGQYLSVPVGVYTVHINGFAISSATGTALRSYLVYTDDNWATSSTVNYSNSCGTTMTSGASYRCGYGASLLVQVTQQLGVNAPVHCREYSLVFISSGSVTLTDHDTTIIWIPA